MNRVPRFLLRPRQLLQTLNSKPFSSSTSKPHTPNPNPFASFNCYTHHDPATPYYVIDSGSPSRPQRNEPVVAEIPGGVERLRCRSCDVYLVGVRRDEESVQVVKTIIKHLKPEVVFLELCASRQFDLQTSQSMTAVQAPNVAFRVAFEEAVANGCKVVLGDCPFEITAQKILAGMLAMRILEFIKLSFYLLIRFMEYGKDNKVFKINDFLCQKLDELKAFPTLQKPTIHERDLYMSSVLAKVAKDHSSVVAVISRDHTIGIKKHLQEIGDNQVQEKDWSDASQ